MNRKYLVLTAGMLLLLLTACASSSKEMKANQVKRVGIINLFQDLPAFTKVTLSKSLMGKAALPDMRNYLSQKLVTAFEGAGIQAYVVRDHLPLLRGEVDLILELQPRKREEEDLNDVSRYQDPLEEDGTNGYGFYYRVLLIDRKGPESYVTMAVVTVENQAGSLVPTSEYAISNKERLNLSILADGWEKQSDDEKKVMELGLQKMIDNSVAETLSKLGF